MKSVTKRNNIKFEFNEKNLIKNSNNINNKSAFI